MHHLCDPFFTGQNIAINVPTPNMKKTCATSFTFPAMIPLAEILTILPNFLMLFTLNLPKLSCDKIIDDCQRNSQPQHDSSCHSECSWSNSHKKA